MKFNICTAFVHVNTTFPDHILICILTVTGRHKSEMNSNYVVVVQGCHVCNKRKLTLSRRQNYKLSVMPSLKSLKPRDYRRLFPLGRSPGITLRISLQFLNISPPKMNVKDKYATAIDTYFSFSYYIQNKIFISYAFP